MRSFHNLKFCKILAQGRTKIKGKTFRYQLFYFLLTHFCRIIYTDKIQNSRIESYSNIKIVNSKTLIVKTFIAFIDVLYFSHLITFLSYFLAKFLREKHQITIDENKFCIANFWKFGKKSENIRKLKFSSKIYSEMIASRHD